MRLTSSYPIGAVLFFVAAIWQLLAVDVLGDAGNVSGGVVWILITLGAAAQWLHLRQRDRETADAMGLMVAMLTAALARALTN